MPVWAGCAAQLAHSARSALAAEQTAGLQLQNREPLPARWKYFQAEVQELALRMMGRLPKSPSWHV